MARSKFLIKFLVFVGALAVIAFLFVRSARNARSQPYTIERASLRNWTVVLRPASAATDPMLALQPPSELAGELFRQVFTRTMESLSAPAAAGIPLVLQGEFERAIAGRATPDALVAAARSAGLESAALEPRCLVHRRVSGQGSLRQLYFVLFDGAAFGRFRQQVAALDGGAPRAADFDPDALSPVMMVAASDPGFNRWLPLRADPATDCLAPIVAE
jgi:hypothetical protein